MVNKGLFTDHATDRVHHAVDGRLAFRIHTVKLEFDPPEKLIS